jgi:hypothetical protein
MFRPAVAIFTAQHREQFNPDRPILIPRSDRKTPSKRLNTQQTPAPNPLQLRISIRKIPPNNDLVLAAADNSTSIKLQLENAVAALAVVDHIVVSSCVSLCMCLSVREMRWEEVGVALDSGSSAGLELWRVIWCGRLCLGCWS